ncbi:ABC-type multidrug transport system fused ATPase/permease subunit [Paenibacillus castaneae]|uniref:ABC transporter ATP-binding protein n=1 Tax=Paenibacillus castaneae TaxID=474957 RepID=UPI000C9CE0E3|nr:ABC transporter ATP-binding protein [Paenibacillus castaneae]NIK79093.1 ABC-type multidrug transport system fused ATPase/permease subunit [Paenibacillus castaneae]
MSTQPLSEISSSNTRKSIFSLFKDPTFLSLLSIVKKYKWYYVFAVGSQLLLTALALLFADTSRWLFNLAPHVPRSSLAHILLLFSCIAIFQLIFTFINNWIRSALNESVVYEMRRTILNHLQRLPLSFHENNHSSVSVNVMHNELEIAKNFIVYDIQRLIALPISFLFVGIYLLTVHPLLGVIAIAIGPIQMLSSLVLKTRFKHAAELQNRVTRDVFFTIGETLHGIREVKSNQMEDKVDHQMAKIQRDGVAYNVLLTNISTIRAIVKDLPGHAGYLAGIGIGASLMASGEIGVGGLVAFITLLDKVAEPFTVMVDTINNLQRSISGAKRLFEVLDLEEEDLTTGEPLSPEAPSIRYDNVSFQYVEESATIQNLSFSIPAGSSLALVGPSGAGKSTIVKLLYRFYDAKQGMITLNDKPLEAYAIQSIRERMALVSQDIFLFDGTVADNIEVGKPGASREEIIRAAKLSQSYEFIEALPLGLDSEIGERGIKLSHGQKQRLSIARAILRNASLLVLDEPTSALDVDTEASFQRDLGEWASSCTKIIIAHRLSTIREADYIIFIDQGEVVESGTIEQLISLNGRFRSYWDKQNGDTYVKAI